LHGSAVELPKGKSDERERDCECKQDQNGYANNFLCVQ
jgi:hypothetical protein